MPKHASEDDKSVYFRHVQKVYYFRLVHARLSSLILVIFLGPLRHSQCTTRSLHLCKTRVLTHLHTFSTSISNKLVDRIHRTSISRMTRLMSATTAGLYFASRASRWIPGPRRWHVCWCRRGPRHPRPRTRWWNHSRRLLFLGI